MMKEPELHFFIGKGGVGKSTTSAIASVHYSNTTHNTLLVSMDPAHNQRDIFGMDFSEKPKQVTEKLAVKEVDTDFWIQKYLKETQEHIKKTYTYHSAFNLQNYFNVLQFSPGIEEYALLMAFEDIIHRFEDKDMIVFDMAPTALTLKFLSLPLITLVWLGELLKLRQQIYEKKEIVSKIKIGKKEIEQDKVKAKLETLIDNYEHLRDHLTAANTKINLVMNVDQLSFSEAVRIKKKLSDIGLHIDRVVINKLKDGENTDPITAEFNDQKIRLFPLTEKNLSGLERINAYIDSNIRIFEDG
jgi:arsenite-transporting ATPase